MLTNENLVRPFFFYFMDSVEYLPKIVEISEKNKMHFPLQINSFDCSHKLKCQLSAQKTKKNCLRRTATNGCASLESRSGGFDPIHILTCSGCALLFAESQVQSISRAGI